MWRNKCAFSDGVSDINNSWHNIKKQFIDNQITDSEYHSRVGKIKHCRPMMKESFYYRTIFNSLFGNNANVIPHFWMPRWTNVIDPSARELDDYKE